MRRVLLFCPILTILFFFSALLVTPCPVMAQNFNVASTYPIVGEGVLSGDVLIYEREVGVKTTNVSYDNRIFGVLNDQPMLVIREATSSSRPVIRAGDTITNVTDFNGEIKKGDFITSSPVSGKGMRAGQSGYTLGIAIEDAVFTNQTVSAEGRQARLGTVKVAIRIEYAELTTARNNIRFLNDLNAAFFRNIRDPERFTATIRYLIAGLIAIIAFAIGFFSITRSISKAVEAIGRNPLAKQSIFLSVLFQIGVTMIGAVITIVIIYILVRI